MRELTSPASWTWTGKMGIKMIVHLADLIFDATGRDSIDPSELGTGQHVTLTITVTPQSESDEPETAKERKE